MRLYGVAFHLFPEEEGVEWRFRAEEMVEEEGRFRVRGGLSGGRYVEGRLDLRLFAPEVVVEPGDNLRAPYARVEILKGCYRLELSRPGRHAPANRDRKLGQFLGVHGPPPRARLAASES